jgi:hypothetical protein
MASKALVHNGCTTGVEAYVMRVPALTYMATKNEIYDFGLYALPNTLSHQCFDFEALVEMLRRVMSGDLGAAGGEERRHLMGRHLVAQEGPLACDRIVDVIEKIVADPPRFSEPHPMDKLLGRFQAARRRSAKWSKSFLPGSKYRPEFQRHRYPGLSIAALRERVSRFQKLLEDETSLSVEPVSEHIFRISQ